MHMLQIYYRCASGQMTFKNIKAALTEYVTRIVQMDNLCRIKLIWMAEGLFEYLKPKQQRATISHISSIATINILIERCQICG